MKNVLLVASAFVSILAITGAARAADTDILIQSSAWDVNQVGIAGALAVAGTPIAKADTSNIVGMASAEANDIDDITANVSVSDVNQLGLAVAIAWDWDGVATADVTDVAGLVNIDANGLTGNSDILSLNTVVDVNQFGGSLAVGGNKAYATTQQLAGVTIANLDGVPSGADVGNIGLSVNDVNQVGVSIAAAGDIAKSSTSNLAGVGVVTVNVAD